MSFFYYAGRALEIIGMVIVGAALLAGMGLGDGVPSMGKEMMFLGIGSVIFTFGWWLERGK